MQGISETLVKYGKMGLVLHISLSTLSLAGCYTALHFHLPAHRILRFVGVGEDQVSGSGEQQGEGVLGSVAVKTGSTALAAFLLHKALFPLRAPVTVAAAPVVAALLRRIGRW
mmetsp:Transcript_4386/g.10225  ORF Transcript_4386/g.10225 Transcript_4386/m.10225 type:complete len:113 (+) Transcript_4386:53-391(+)